MFQVDVIANSLVLYLPFCSTLNKNFFSSSSSSTCYNININGAKLYNIESCTHLEDSRTKMYNYIYKNKRVVLPVFAKMYNIIEKR